MALSRPKHGFDSRWGYCRQVQSRSSLIRFSNCMIRRTGTLGFAAIFLASILCAVICPAAESHGGHHVCDKPDHSCCPKSQDRSNASQCVDTHFTPASKYHHPSLDLGALLVDVTALENLPQFVQLIDSFQLSPAPPQDLLARHRILRI